MAAAVTWALAVSVRRSLQEVAAAAASATSCAQRAAQQGAAAARSATSTAATVRSVETLVVIVAAIVLAAALAGVLARVCGGRYVVPSGDGRDVEGWVERRCRSCLDSGLPPLAPVPASSKASEAK
ncbi:hypothetical protein HU200_014668 [Digitaria exilis]|uniref:Uncharacterized protein n=1 Tax=Digitaria exilis TaxID=1010633 RepID=A0A835KMN9_9POAL|nr:hypothetical protein HU200_014668 [Digitaria exilis]CAB3493602.1 unnamed protein product [Digitaria exilis]